MDLWLVISSFIVGILVGATGMGGGTIMTPLLILVFRIPPSIAIGTDLVYSAITKSFGAWQHWRQGTVDWILLRRVIMGSIPGTLVGTILLTWLKNDKSLYLNEWMSQSLAMVFLVISGIMCWQLFQKKDKAVSKNKRIGEPLYVPFIGFLIGFLLVFTSVGSGTLFVALLWFFYLLPANRMVGTDIVHGVIITAIAGIAHVSLGTVDWGLVFNLLLGSIPGVVIGSRLTKKLPDIAVRLGMIMMLIVAAIKLMSG